MTTFLPKSEAAFLTVEGKTLGMGAIRFGDGLSGQRPGKGLIAHELTHIAQQSVQSACITLRFHMFSPGGTPLRGKPAIGFNAKTLMGRMVQMEGDGTAKLAGRVQDAAFDPATEELTMTFGKLQRMR